MALQEQRHAAKTKIDGRLSKVSIRPVSLSLQLIEKVSEWQPISASEIARRLALPKATVHRLLLGLENFGWLERDEGPRPLWSQTTRAIAIGGRAIERRSNLRMAALPIMDALRQATGETVHLGLLDDKNENIILVERIDGTRNVNLFLPIGSVWPLHWSSGGCAILANFSEDLQENYLRKPIYRRKSESDILPLEELSTELIEIRRRRFSITVGFPPATSSSIGAAIFDRRGFPFAGLSINGASERLRTNDLLALAPQLLEAARRISIGMSGDRS